MDTRTPRRHRAALAGGIAALVAASVLIAPPALAQSAPPATVSIDLEGTWKFTKGDDPSYASPSFDDSAWSDIQVPGDGSPFASYDGFAWYRLDFTLPAEAQGTNLVASLGFLDDIDEAFLNGVRIGGSGTMPPAASSQWFEKRLYPVPADAPNFGGENTLAVRLYDMNGGGGWYEGPVGIFSKDAVRENVYGISGPLASAEQTAAVNAFLAAQRAALASGNIRAYLATLDKDYFHDGRSKERRERELRSWLAESGTLTLTDGEVEVVQGADGSLIVDTNRTITGTRDGQPYTFQPAAQQFLRFSSSTLTETGNASRFFRETVDSTLEGSPREFVTYLPPSYLEEPNRSYPVVYLFHGINGGSREWEPRDIDDVLDGLWAEGLAESIVIMPDGESLWYADQPNGVPWRSMFLTEMMPLVDAEYRTLPTREFRGLSGVSMGGFGAYSIGLSNPDKFSSLASHIGALSFSSAGLPTPLAQVAGMTTEQLSAYDFYFDACEFDEYRFDNAARSMSATLTTKGVPHTWLVEPEGRHNDACWMPHLRDSFRMHSDNFRSSGLVEDTIRPTATLVSPTTAGPFPTLTLTVDATDNKGLTRIVANVYRGTTLVKSTQSAAGGAVSASHTANVTLPDGAYTVRYNAQDTSGNISATKTFDVTVDATKPTVTVKTGANETVGSNGGYSLVSFKLYDAGKIDKVVLNGVVKDLSNNAWSDVNFVKPGVFGAKAGANSLVVYDVAGNTTTMEFTLR
ncbi:alpha/beta hydrolase-fold protein [Microbacterium sp. SLBN-146]|uniref:alpha/beta hydrolase-fold protein n=1 Tax=Microbacterium sp. SLBN-146 TaxID=2768457 RepID=UPI001150CB1F|nr:alpha/beta hydrolase-fold protein [Microbacterium sp. SLBN-146]TQJ30039.1 S-formylglutathione hydrolase FrmB [Microbacterium sp. SLBN-146]